MLPYVSRQDNQGFGPRLTTSRELLLALVGMLGVSWGVSGEIGALHTQTLLVSGAKFAGDLIGLCCIDKFRPANETIWQRSGHGSPWFWLLGILRFVRFVEFVSVDCTKTQSY